MTLDIGFLRRHLLLERSAFVTPRIGRGPDCADTAIHATAYRDDPELYALHAVMPQTPSSQRLRILYQILSGGRSGLPLQVQCTLNRVAEFLLASEPTDGVLRVLLALRRARVNRKHASRAVLRYVLNHPRLEWLAARRRQTMIDCIEHAAGRDVTRACAKRIRTGNDDDAYVRRHLIRFAHDPLRAARFVGHLYERHSQPPAKSQRAATWVQRDKEDVPGAYPRPKTVTATNRGDIAATLVHIYRGGSAPELTAALADYVDRTAAMMPKFDGSVSVVLDASASTQGYGEREFCCISQSVALSLVLERCCTRFQAHRVGGAQDPPRPAGHTDLAAGLLDAMANEPDIVVIISDGYENVAGGDLNRVVQACRAGGFGAPVVFCHSKFTEKDSLEYRRPTVSLPELEFWHELDFKDILLSVFSMAKGEAGRRFARALDRGS